MPETETRMSPVDARKVDALMIDALMKALETYKGKGERENEAARLEKENGEFEEEARELEGEMGIPPGSQEDRDASDGEAGLEAEECYQGALGLYVPLDERIKDLCIDLLGDNSSSQTHLSRLKHKNKKINKRLSGLKELKREQVPRKLLPSPAEEEQGCTNREWGEFLAEVDVAADLPVVKHTFIDMKPPKQESTPRSRSSPPELRSDKGDSAPEKKAEHLEQEGGEVPEEMPKLEGEQGARSGGDGEVGRSDEDPDSNDGKGLEAKVRRKLLPTPAEEELDRSNRQVNELLAQREQRELELGCARLLGVVDQEAQESVLVELQPELRNRKGGDGQVKRSQGDPGAIDGEENRPDVLARSDIRELEEAAKEKLSALRPTMEGKTLNITVVAKCLCNGSEWDLDLADWIRVLKALHDKREIKHEHVFTQSGKRISRLFVVDPSSVEPQAPADDDENSWMRVRGNIHTVFRESKRKWICLSHFPGYYKEYTGEDLEGSWKLQEVLTHNRLRDVVKVDGKYVWSRASSDAWRPRGWR